MDKKKKRKVVCISQVGVLYFAKNKWIRARKAAVFLFERTDSVDHAPRTLHDRSQAMYRNRPDNERKTRTTRIVTFDFNGGSHVCRNHELGMTDMTYPTNPSHIH